MKILPQMWGLSVDMHISAILFRNQYCQAILLLKSIILLLNLALDNYVFNFLIFKYMYIILHVFFPLMMSLLLLWANISRLLLDDFIPIHSYQDAQWGMAGGVHYDYIPNHNPGLQFGILDSDFKHIWLIYLLVNWQVDCSNNT